MSATLNIFNDSWIRANLGAGAKTRNASPQNSTRDIARLLENLSGMSADSRGGLVSALQGNGNLTTVAAQAGTGNAAEMMARSHQMVMQAEQMARTAKTPSEVLQAQQTLAKSQQMYQLISSMLRTQHDTAKSVIQNMR